MSAAAPSGSVDVTNGRFRLASPRTVEAVGVVTLVLIAASLPLAALAHQMTFSNLGLGPLLGLPFTVVGAVVAHRQPRNPIGWLLLAFGFFGALCADAGMYAVLHYRLGHTGLPFGPLAVFLAPTWIPLIVLLPLPIALFPDGRMPSARWRATVWAYGGLAVLWLGVLAVWQADGILLRPIQVDSSGQTLILNQPTGVWKTLNMATSVLLIPYLVLSLAWVVRQIRAYRRAAGETRQQLKWLMGGGAVCIAGFITDIALSGQKAQLLSVISYAGVTAFAALPISIGVGILRYRLYEIDRLISRTLSYLIVTGLLVSMFLGLVVVITRVLPFSSPVAVAASTLAAAALFNPLRRRVQRLVDRRFNRARYDVEATVTAFRLRLREAVDLETVQGELLQVVAGAVEPTHTSLWIRPSGTGSRR